MNILLIGGHRFVGKAIIEAARTRGDTVTAFNRGTTWPENLTDVELIKGAREHDVERLRGRKWDIAIDTNAYAPSTVTSLTRILADQIQHYTVVSTLSVYPWPLRPGVSEGAPTITLESGVDADEDLPENYGARKALCERSAAATMPGRTLALRVGMIVGPHDYLDRFTYWLERCSGTAPFIAPGEPNRQLQLIDVADLARWTLDLAERRVSGTVHATGPTQGTLTMKALIDTCRAATGGSGKAMWVPDHRLEEQGLAPDADFPYWIPARENGLFEVDLRRARSLGLITRPLLETALRTWSWVQTRSARERNRGILRSAEEAIMSTLPSAVDP